MTLEIEVSQPSVKAEASAWRVGPKGVLINSVIARHAATFADSDPDGIYFYADLTVSSESEFTDSTMQKIYEALGSIGLTETQILAAVNEMQSRGLIIEERLY